jgi:hypothetical protein
MLRKLLQTMALIACLTPAWGKETLKLPVFRQPSTVFVVGPGTVMTVHLLQLPFLEPHYAVKYKTDSGELIEVWTPRKDILVVDGMHGILTYSINPERILNFRVVEQTQQSSDILPRGRHSTCPAKKCTQKDLRMAIVAAIGTARKRVIPALRECSHSNTQPFG